MRKFIIISILIAVSIILSVDLFHKLNEVGQKMKPDAGLIPAVQVIRMDATGKSTLDLVAECDAMHGELIAFPTYFQCEIDL
jgi:riboflavin transporter FmnP